MMTILDKGFQVRRDVSNSNHKFDFIYTVLVKKNGKTYFDLVSQEEIPQRELKNYICFGQSCMTPEDLENQMFANNEKAWDDFVAHERKLFADAGVPYSPDVKHLKQITLKDPLTRCVLSHSEIQDLCRQYKTVTRHQCPLMWRLAQLDQDQWRSVRNHMFHDHKNNKTLKHVKWENVPHSLVNVIQEWKARINQIYHSKDETPMSHRSSKSKSKTKTKSKTKSKSRSSHSSHQSADRLPREVFDILDHPPHSSRIDQLIESFKSYTNMDLLNLWPYIVNDAEKYAVAYVLVENMTR